MRYLPIYDSYPEPCEERRYLIAVAERVEGIVGTELDFVSAIALITFLGTQTVEFLDGFVIGAEDPLSHFIGFEMASVVGACFCVEPRRAPEWWKSVRPTGVADSRFDAAWKNIVAAFDRQEDVLCIR